MAQQTEIRIKNIDSPAVTAKMLRNEFGKFGKVIRNSRILDWGGAYITMAHKEEAEKAIAALNGQKMGSKKIRVLLKKSAPSNNTQSRKFVNPYNFIPVKEVKASDETLRLLYSDASHCQEKFMDNNTSSGRIVCKITTESDIFIGAGKSSEEAANDSPAKIQPYLLNDKRAIPPSSIKGMFSTIMEASSNSALRVLENKKDYYYTRRVEARPPDPLSQIGILRIKNDDYKIEPLTGEYIYLNQYRFNRKTRQFDISGQLRTMSLKDYSVEPVFYYAKKSDFMPKSSRFSCRSLKTNTDSLIDENAYKALSNPNKKKYIKGILKYFGVEGRDKTIPRGKKHEFFIEYNGKGKKSNIFVPKTTIEEFNLLALEAYERDDCFPFTPFGRHAGRNGHVKLRDGDVLFYRTKNGNVDKLSFSAIWRDFCGNDKTDNNPFGFFGRIDKNGFLLPPGLINQNITDPKELKLTSVSSLLGFVEEKKQSGKQQAEALAGRLFFSPGILSPVQTIENIVGSEKKIKILDSPKPPCPEFYFHDKGNHDRYIKKKDLKPEGSIKPNGRKFYWQHHNQEEPYVKEGTYKNENERKAQISRIEPINSGVSFLFTIDFFNLTEFELGMLLYAVKPTKKFRHLIGMGKPIGLGKVKIDILDLLCIDRKRRYNEDKLFDDHFFHSKTDTVEGYINEIRKKWTESDNQADNPTCFEKQRFCPPVKENKTDNSQNDDKKNTSGNILQNISCFVEIFKKKIHELYGEDWLIPLENIGDPESTKGLNVRYPPDPNDPEGYDEAFKWWVRNAGKDKDDQRRSIRGKNAVLGFIHRTAGATAPQLPVDPRQ